jgi:hypothetical protein
MMYSRDWRSKVASFALLLACHCGESGDAAEQQNPIVQAGSSAAAPQGGGAAGTNAPAPGAGSSAQGGGAGRAGSTANGGSGAAGTSGGSAGGSGAAGMAAAGSSGDAGSPAGGSGGSSGGGRFPEVSSLTAEGPFTVTTETASGPNGGYTLHYPAMLGMNGLKHPFVTWGNGATTVPALFPMLQHLASHGFVVIASNNAFVTGAELKAGLDWLEAENARGGSEFYQKLDPTKLASFGYSLGSLGTFEIADDPRLVTTVHISGGAMDKSVVPNLRNPAAFLCGDPSDIAHANCESDFELAQVPVFYGVFPGEHLGILGAFEQQIREATTGWLRWKLMGEESRAPMFTGPDCTLCKDERWTVKQKNL